MEFQNFKDRYGNVVPATKATIDLVKFNKKQCEGFFGEKTLEKGSNLDYASWFQKRIALYELWLEQCRIGYELFKDLAFEEEL